LPGDIEAIQSIADTEELSLMDRIVENITAGGVLCAIIVRAEFREPGIKFFTTDELSQQLAFMRHPAGKLIPPHVHNPVPREVQFTQEVLLIRRGKLRVDFYDATENYLESRVLEAGDVILLVQGGHGFEVIEEVEMIEVKQGPYVGEHDKTRFVGIDKDQVKVPR
jgi:mannose-6-phosphate isomerase-like protein (cupin superfamily)